MKKEVIKLQLVFKNHFKKRSNPSSQLFYKNYNFIKYMITLKSQIKDLHKNYKATFIKSSYG